MDILVVDIGGNNIKLQVTGSDERRKVPSGRSLGAERMVLKVLAATSDWNYDVVSVGFPGPVREGSPSQEPVNLGTGWIRFDLDEAFGCPVRVMNDAAMQALGSYDGGRMLFLGLGTGLGTALIIDDVVQPMEMGHLPYRKGRSFEECVGSDGLRRLGRKKWERCVHDVVARLADGLQVEYVVLGGGNVKKLKKLPIGARRGRNANAFVGGCRMWEGVRAPRHGESSNGLQSIEDVWHSAVIHPPH